MCIIIGGFLVLDTIIVCFLSNYNLGVILPAVLGVPLLLLGLFWGSMDAGLLLFLRRAILVCYGLGCLFLLFLGSLMLRAIDRGEHGDYDALIVLGAAVHGDRVTWVLSNRLDTAYDYAVAHPDTVLVVSGGQGDGESVTEASAMAGYLTRRGIDPARVLLDTSPAGASTPPASCWRTGLKAPRRTSPSARPSSTRSWGPTPPSASSPPDSTSSGPPGWPRRAASTPGVWARRTCGTSP